MPCLETHEIEAILPQRYPFLLIDRVLDYKKDAYLVAVKNITGNEWTCSQSQPEVVSFPEMLFVEAGLQAGIVFYYVSKNILGSSLEYLVGKVEVDIKRALVVGDRLRIIVRNKKLLLSGGYVNIEMMKEYVNIANINIFFSVKR